MKTIAIAFLACVAILLWGSAGFTQQNVQRIALKSGESVELRNYFFVVNCQSIMIDQPRLDVLEGFEELTVELKEGMILPRALNCPKPVPGGTVVATAKKIDEPKEGRLTIRLKFNTKQGERQGSTTYFISLFP